MESNSRFNPISTSGIGFKLEHCVQASYLVSLIVETPFPFGNGLIIKEISFQAKQKADTDDLIVRLSNDIRNEVHYIQSKKGFSISENTTFYDVIEACFKDFNKDSFDIQCDKFVIATDVLSKADITDGQAILEWARFSSDVEDFQAKLKNNKKKKKKYDQFVKALNKANGGSFVDLDTIWNVLKCIYIKSFDYLETGSKDLQVLQWYLNPHLKKKNSSSDALKTIIGYIGECNQHAATLNSTNIRKDIKDLFSPDQSPKIEKELSELLKKSKSQLIHTIHNDIDGFHLDRTGYLDKLNEMVLSEKFVIITGEGGLGKSGLAKEFIELRYGGQTGFIYIKADQLDRSSLAHTLSDIGITLDFETILAQWLTLPKLLIYIDSFEKLYESDHKEAFLELLGKLKEINNITILATCRTYALETLRIKYRIPKEEIADIPIYPLNKEDLEKIGKAKPTLVKLIQNAKLKKLVVNPFYLNQAILFVGSISDKEQIDERAFRIALWEQVIEKKGDGKAGHSRSRAKVFSQTVIKRALEKQAYTSMPDGADMGIIEELENDNLLIKHSSLEAYATVHDIFEDMVVGKYIEEKFNQKTNTKSFIESIDTNPVFRRGMRIWIQEFINNRPDEAKLFLAEILSLYINNNYAIIDEVFIGILTSSDCYEILNKNKELLFKDELRLFIKLFRLCKVVYTIPIETEYPQIKQKTVGPGWNALLKILDENYTAFEKHFSIIHIDLLHNWALQFEFNDPIPVEGAVISKHCFSLLEKEKSNYRNDTQRHLLEIIFKVAPSAQETTFHFLQKAVELRKKESKELEYKIGFYRELYKMLLEETHKCVRIYELFPELVIELAKIEWYGDNIPQEYSSDYQEQSFGLSKYPYNYFSASAYQTPFRYLFRYHPEKALTFLIEVTNRGIDYYLNSRYSNQNKTQVIQLSLEDGTIIKQHGDVNLWSAHRGFCHVPDLIQSALMAFEEYLLKEASKGENLSTLFDQVLKNSNSVLLTGVLASIANSYPLIFGEKVFSLFNVREFFKWDLSRYSQEYHSNHIAMGNDLYYTYERHHSNKLKHRKYNLEDLVTRLQWYYPKPINEIIDNHLKNLNPKDELWQLALARMDLRNTDPEVDKEKGRILFKPKPLPSKLQEIVDQGADKQKSDAESISIFLWAEKSLKEETNPTIDGWKENYRKSKEIDIKSEFLPANISKQIAAIGLRDFLISLSEEETEFCVREIDDSLEETIRKLKEGYLHSSYNIFEKCIPQVFPILLTDQLKGLINSESIKNSILDLLILLDNKEYRKMLIFGIRKYLWQIDSKFAEDCFQLLLRAAKHPEIFQQISLAIRMEDTKKIDGVLDSIKRGNRIEAKDIKLTADDNIQIVEALEMLPYDFLNGTHQAFLEEVWIKLLRLKI